MFITKHGLSETKLKRFWLIEQGLTDEIKHSSWLAFLVYLVDIFGHVNVMNKDLQGKKHEYYF